jgi:hypothetical protein
LRSDWTCFPARLPGDLPEGQQCIFGGVMQALVEEPVGSLCQFIDLVTRCVLFDWHSGMLNRWHDGPFLSHDLV